MVTWERRSEFSHHARCWLDWGLGLKQTPRQENLWKCSARIYLGPCFRLACEPKRISRPASRCRKIFQTIGGVKQEGKSVWARRRTSALLQPRSHRLKEEVHSIQITWFASQSFTTQHANVQGTQTNSSSHVPPSYLHVQKASSTVSSSNNDIVVGAQHGVVWKTGKPCK